MPVEGLFERPQPSLSKADLASQHGLLVDQGVGLPVLVDMAHAGAGKDLNRATTEPGLP